MGDREVTASSPAAPSLGVRMRWRDPGSAASRSATSAIWNRVPYTRIWSTAVASAVGVGSAGPAARYTLVRMSASDVAVVRRVYDALDGLAGLHDPNFDRIAEECFAPEYAFAFARPGGTGLEPEYRGLQGFREALDTWMEGWEWWETTVEDFVDLGDRGVLVLSRSRGRSPSGLEVDVETAELQEMRDGRMVRTVSYPTRSEALALYGH